MANPHLTILKRIWEDLLIEHNAMVREADKIELDMGTENKAKLIDAAGETDAALDSILRAMNVLKT